MRWKKDRVDSMFNSKHEAYDGGIDRAILLIGIHAEDKGPAEVIEMIKCLKTDAKYMEG